MQIVNPLNPDLLKKVYNFSDDSFIWAESIDTSIFSLGAMVGCIFTGFLIERYGRYKINLAVLAVELSICFIYIIKWFPLFLVARFLSGVVGGLSSSICGPYIQEAAARKHKNFGKLSIFVFMTLGSTLGNLLCALLDTHIYEYWRFILFWPSIVTIFRFSLFATIFTFDTPRHLISKDAPIDEILHSISKQYTLEAAEKVYNREVQIYKETQKINIPTYASIFKPPYRYPLFLAFFLAFAQQISGSSLIVFYSTSIFQSYSNLNSYWITFIVGFGNMAGATLALSLKGVTEKKDNFVYGIMGMLLGFYALNWGLSLDRQYLPVISALVYMISFGYGLGGTLYAYIPEILPATGVGMAMFVKWMFIGLANLIVPTMIDKLGLFWSLNFFLVMNCISLVVIQVFGVETRGMNSAEIMRSFKKKSKLSLWEKFIKK